MSVIIHKTDILQETPTVSQSLNVVKNLISTSLGSLCYIRNIFPEHHFKETSMNGVMVKKFKDKSHDIFNWIEKGVYDAVEKKYLKTLEFGIYSVDSQTKIETYEFNFSYPSDGSYSMAIHSIPDVKLTTKREITRATTELLRRLLTMTQVLESLPDHVSLTMKLFYYPHTPADYEPPYFVAGQDDDAATKARMDMIQIGNVNTPYHCLNLTVRTCKPGLENEATMDQDVPMGETTHEPDTQTLIQELTNGVHHTGHQQQNHQPEKPPTGFRMPETPISSKKKVDGMRHCPSRQSVSCKPIPPSSPSEFGDSRLSTEQLHLHECATQDISHELGPGLPDLSVNPAFENLHQNTPMDFETSLSALFHDTQGKLTRSRFSMMMTPKADDLDLEHETVMDDVQNQDDVLSVDCPCGVHHSDGEMIQCEACGHWNHLACVGFMDGSDPRLDTYSHQCYTCLFKATKSNSMPSSISDLLTSLYKAMKSYLFFYPNADTSTLFQEVCLIRRAWVRIWNDPDEFTNVRSIRSAMGITVNRATCLRDKLIQEGVLIQTKTQSGKARGLSAHKTKALQKRFNTYWMTHLPLLALLRTESVQAFADPFVRPKVSTTAAIGVSRDGNEFSKKRALDENDAFKSSVKKRKVSVVARDFHVR